MMFTRTSITGVQMSLLYIDARLALSLFIRLILKPFSHMFHFETFATEPRYEKTGFCVCENKDADQLRDYREADQRLCFRYIDSTIPLLIIYEISSL